MKIAYIMLCHKNSEQINDLISTLTSENSDIFIHVDLKSSIKNDIIKNKHVFILPDEYRHSINWGSNEMILATLELIKYVKASKKKYDYIWLISGQDFPIVSNDEIENRLKKNKGYSYIEIINKNSKEYSRYKKLYDVWYPTWISKDKLLIKIIKRMYMLVTGGFRHTFKIFKRRKPFDFDFYFGSQWWCLTSNCAFEILEFCNKNPQYINYYNNTIIPDECFFQTIFMNTKYRNKVKDYLTFVNWKNNRRSPETLKINDYNLLIKQSKKKCFARKFDYDVDKEIIKKIYKEGVL